MRRTEAATVQQRSRKQRNFEAYLCRPAPYSLQSTSRCSGNHSHTVNNGRVSVPPQALGSLATHQSPSKSLETYTNFITDSYPIFLLFFCNWRVVKEQTTDPSENWSLGCCSRFLHSKLLMSVTRDVTIFWITMREIDWDIYRLQCELRFVRSELSLDACNSLKILFPASHWYVSFYLYYFPFLCLFACFSSFPPDFPISLLFSFLFSLFSSVSIFLLFFHPFLLFLFTFPSIFFRYFNIN
jgi:hypothetical protein